MDPIFEKQLKELGSAVRKSIGENSMQKKSEFTNFFPTPIANFYAKLIYDAVFVRQLFRVITMPGKTFKIPSILTGAKTYYQPTTGGTATATTVTTGQIDLDAKKLMSQISVPMESFEDFNPNNEDGLDSIIAESFVNGMADAEEDAFLNGDTTHTATALTEAAATEANWYQFDPRLIVDGLVKIGLNDGQVVDAEGADASESLLRDVFFKLGKYAKNKKDIAIIWNSYSANQLLGDDSLRTVDKYGPQAQIVSGELGKIYASTNVESTVLGSGYAVATHVKNVIIGDRRLVKVKNDEVITTDSMTFVGSERVDMKVERSDAVVVIENLSAPSAS